jgi:uncharacterized membrane protein
MKKKTTILNVMAWVIALLPLCFLAIRYDSIPERIAMHYDVEMQPDDIRLKSELWIITGVLAAVSILVSMLLQNIHRFDPKRKNIPSSTFNKLGFGMVVFFSALSTVMVATAGKDAFSLSRLLFPLIGLLFMFLGNYLPALKPNYFAGIRLPWTLSDDDNWRRTHFLAGKIWFWVGLAFAVITLFLPVKAIMPVFIGLVIIMILIPGVYSYRLFREKSRQSRS